MFERAESKGIRGEVQIASVLNTLREQEGLMYLHNVILPKKGDNITQVDFIALTRKRFICIEVKAWTGIIFADRTARYWRVQYPTKIIAPQSPYLQNDSHIKALNSVSDYAYENYVVFPTNPIIKNKFNGIGTTADFIQYLNTGNLRYTTGQMQEEYRRLAAISENNTMAALFKALDRFDNNVLSKGDSYNGY